MKYPDADDHPDAAEAARERYDTLGAIGKEAAPEAIEAQLDDVMDVDGYLSWLAFNTLVRNGGTLLISPEGAEGGESDVSVWLRVACCVLSRKSQPPQGPLGLVPSLPGEPVKHLVAQIRQTRCTSTPAAAWAANASGAPWRGTWCASVVVCVWKSSRAEDKWSSSDTSMRPEVK